MAYNDFGTLQTRVKSYLDNRTDVDDEIKDWINDSRRSIAKEYNFDYLYTEATCQTSAASGRYALPSDYLGNLSLFLGTKKLVKILPTEFDDIHGDSVNITSVDNTSPYLLTTGSLEQDEPDYYIERGMEFDLYPIPDDAYTLTIHYYSSPTTWTLTASYDYISTFHTEAVVFGAVMRGAIFLDDDAKLKKFGPLYEHEINTMIKKEKDKHFKDSGIRMKSYKDFSISQFKRLMKTRN